MSVLDEERGLVEFTSAVGRARAQWMGTEAPRCGAQYRVEVEIPDEVSGARARPPLPPGFLTGDPGDGTVVSGTVEEVADDGVVALRVGSDVVLLEMAEGEALPEAAQTMSVRVPRIELYPYEL